MKTSVIYNSYTGNTRGIAEQIHEACGGDLVEVKSLQYSSRFTAYTIGCYRATKEECDRIEPASIDISASDCVVIGTPVWGRKATPAINGAVAALIGCEGKPVVIFATCGGKAGNTLPILAKALAAKGMTVAGQFVFTREDTRDAERVNALISKVKETGSAA
jgi:flavodoxin